jgi:hypothetical protein
VCQGSGVLNIVLKTWDNMSADEVSGVRAEGGEGSLTLTPGLMTGISLTCSSYNATNPNPRTA